MSDHKIEDQPKETLKEAAAEQPAAETRANEGIIKEAEPISRAPEPVVTGNEQVAFLKHDIYRKIKDDGAEEIGIEMAIKNQSKAVLGSVSFEAVLYDIEGRVIDTLGHKELEILENSTRTVRIISKSPDADKTKSYAVSINKIVLPPISMAQGNDRVVILKHELTESAGEQRGSCIVDFAIRNVSDVTAASIFFEIKIFDIEGYVLETVKHSEIELRPETSRAVQIPCARQFGMAARAYDIKIARMVTADFEKVQLRRNETRTNPAGEEEVDGIVKNISTAKTDAALVANFFDSKKENIGSRVIILKDIEPEGIKRFHCKFKPQPGDIVRSFTLTIGDLVENLKQQ